MPRIRTLKPEFWTDEKLALLDPVTRLVFLGLISMSDDHGRLIDNVKMLDGQLFPFTDDSCADSLETLASLSRILRYTSKSGQNLIQIVGWKAHQKVDHPGKEILPAPTKEDWLQPVADQRPIKPPRKPSRKSRDSLANDSRTIPTTNDLGPTTNDQFASGETRSVGWPVEAAAMWSERVAVIEIPRAGAALKKLVDRYGWPDVKNGLSAYIECNDGKTRKMEWFADDSVRWVEKLGKMQNNDENGLTERGKLAWAAAQRTA